jgi:hypothetical protein
MGARKETRDRRAAFVRLGGLLAAVLAAVGLILLPPGGRASADAGGSSSAVTKSGTKGPYDDFSNLKVTVEQTKELRDQAVKVSWTGGTPTQQIGVPNGADFLEIMQCWGDSTNGPDREQCVWGQGPVGSGQVDGRQVGFGPGPAHLDDPQETTYQPSPTGAPQSMPFHPANGPSTLDPTTYFTQLTSNEQPVLQTGADGTGGTVFTLESAATAKFLGCGAVATSGQVPKPCWLVVIPRGEHEPNGSMASSTNGLITSALSASNWAQRIVFRLDFKPIGAYCTLGQKTHLTIGSELTEEAMTSWQPTLCTDDKITYTYNLQSRDYSRQQITAPTTGSPGLAFVESPIVPQPGSPPVVHAPVAVSGLVIGFNIEFAGSSKQVPRIRLNARLVAKMLTSSYQCDIPAVNTQTVRGKLSPHNAQALSLDPEFLKLNPNLGNFQSQSCSSDLGVPQGASDYAAQVWRWLRSDPTAESFLKGEPDPWGMKINPYFLDQLKPADNALSEFWKPDPTTWVPDSSYPNLGITALAVNPYGGDLHDDATRVRKANNTGASALNLTAVPPKFDQSPQTPGQFFALGLTDAATAARYRLGTAELLNADGQYVAPTAAALTKAVAGMTTGPVPGVLNADPGLKTPDAYPLTAVTYAAASTGLDAASRTDFATLIRYAVGPGQQSGIGNGLLPPGYTPLTTTLREQALSAASALVAGAPKTPPPGGAAAGTTGGTSSGGSSGGGSGGTSAGGTGGLTGGGTGGAVPGTTTGGTPSSGKPTTPAAAAAAGGPSATPSTHNVAQTGGTTPGALLGAVRWVLLIVLIAGIAGSLAGPLLMRLGATGGSMRTTRPVEGNSR